jgi:hypothetical protein
VAASDLYLPQSWDQDRTRCQRAGIPDEVTHRPTWKIAIEQVKSAQIYLVKHKEDKAYCPVPTDHTYWLIVARNPQSGEIK